MDLVTVIAAAPSGGAAVEYINAIVAAIGALTLALGGLAVAAAKLYAQMKLWKTQAAEFENGLTAVVKGSEAALEPLKTAHPALYKKSKDVLRAAVDDANAQGVVAPIVEEAIHGGAEAKPHTKPEMRILTPEDLNDGPTATP